MIYDKNFLLQLDKEKNKIIRNLIVYEPNAEETISLITSPS